MVATECSYDYIFVYDGDSYQEGELLGSFSGRVRMTITEVAPLTFTVLPCCYRRVPPY